MRASAPGMSAAKRRAAATGIRWSSSPQRTSTRERAQLRRAVLERDRGARAEGSAVAGPQRQLGVALDERGRDPRRVAAALLQRPRDQPAGTEVRGEPRDDAVASEAEHERRRLGAWIAGGVDEDQRGHLVG